MLLTLKPVYRLPLRAFQGFAMSLRRLEMLALAVPNYSTLSRRAKALRALPVLRNADKAVHLLADSTGLKRLATANGRCESTAIASGAASVSSIWACRPERGRTIDRYQVTTEEWLACAGWDNFRSLLKLSHHLFPRLPCPLVPCLYFP